MGARRDERFDSDLRIKLDRGDGPLGNVRPGGAYFLTYVDLKPGESLRFTLEFSGLQIGFVSARCAARVVRADPHGRLRGIGATFESIEFHRVGARAQP